MQQEITLVFALYNRATGDLLLRHPSQPDVFVSKSHFESLLKNSGNKSIETNCVYTEQQVCTSTVSTPSGQICTGTTTVRTCRCT